jgi:hypothetical protein
LVEPAATAVSAKIENSGAALGRQISGDIPMPAKDHDEVPDLDPDFEVALRMAAEAENAASAGESSKAGKPEKSITAGAEPAGKTKDYKVGYGRTPEHTKFKEGSGNPRGRPKGSLGVKARIRKMLNEKVTVSKNGKPVKMTRLDIGLAKIAEKLMSGDLKAFAYLLSLLNDGTEGTDSEAAENLAMPDEANLEFVYKRLARRFERDSDGDE